ncbi:hypothetical protein Pcinc_030635, partial [Petrolisthes cinctipes]
PSESVCCVVVAARIEGANVQERVSGLAGKNIDCVATPTSPPPPSPGPATPTSPPHHHLAQQPPPPPTITWPSNPHLLNQAFPQCPHRVYFVLLVCREKRRTLEREENTRERREHKRQKRTHEREENTRERRREQHNNYINNNNSTSKTRNTNNCVY